MSSRRPKPPTFEVTAEMRRAARQLKTQLRDMPQGVTGLVVYIDAGKVRETRWYAPDEMLPAFPPIALTEELTSAALLLAESVAMHVRNVNVALTAPMGPRAQEVARQAVADRDAQLRQLRLIVSTEYHPSGLNGALIVKR